MSSTLQDGAVFGGRYRIVRCIAAGGMGAVYEAVHLETERTVALKVMLPHIVGSADLRERFKREARVAARIKSEYIVDVFDAGVDESSQMPYLVMELLEGEELAVRLERLGRFSQEDVVSHLYQAALALEKTHAASIVHRDLKPENLFLTQREDGSPRIKILDFGIAKIVAQSATQAGTTQSMGTPIYMAPEQLTLERQVSPASDIYSLALIAYTFLVGTSYWERELEASNSVYALVGATAQGPKEPASVRAKVEGVDLPPAFDQWFAKATAADPAARYQSAGEAVAELAEALGVPLPGPSRFSTTGVNPIVDPTSTISVIRVPANNTASSAMSIGTAATQTISSRKKSWVFAAGLGAGALVLVLVVVFAMRGGTSEPVSAAAEDNATASAETPPPPPASTPTIEPAPPATAEPSAEPSAAASAMASAAPVATAPRPATTHRPKPTPRPKSTTSKPVKPHYSRD